MPVAIVPASVPPNVPVPVLRLKLTPVFAVTFRATPLSSWACTITGKPPPAVGLLPPLIDVTTSFVGSLPAVVTVNVRALLAEPATVATTGPVVAPDGTGIVIEVALQPLGAALTLLNLTVLVPCVEPKLFPVIVTAVPMGPEVGERLAIAGGMMVQR